MNQQERDALRNEHTKVTGFIGNKEIVPYCLGCGDYIDDDRQPYPCDVIKVLDAWDEATPTEATSSECDHRTAGLLPEPDGTLEIIEFNFCPKCGEKL